MIPIESLDGEEREGELHFFFSNGLRGLGDEEARRKGKNPKA